MGTVEIELKFLIRLDDIKKITAFLKKKGFRITQKRTYEKTVMYDNPQQLMRATDGRIRIRIIGKSCEFSYKKPLTRKGIKKEEEYEVVVSDFSKLEKILEKMDFKPVSSYERYRTRLEKDHIEVTIDEYPFALFVEIEGEEEKIKKLAQELGFSLENNLTDSCDTLFQKWRSKKGLPFKPHMRFEDYDQ